MGEGELKYHLSTLHFRPSASPPPPSSTPPSSSALRADFHNFQLVRSRREGKQRSRGRAKTPGGWVWKVYFTGADEFEMPSKKRLIEPAHSLPEKGVWGG